MEQAKEETRELSIIKQRQSTTLQDSQDLLDRHTLTLKELVRSRDDLLEELAQASLESGCLKDSKADKLAKYRTAQSDLASHQQEIEEAKDRLFELKTNCEKLRNNRDELSVTLTVKGTIALSQTLFFPA